MNFIYPKYRYYVAVCSIYEYFDSGRCATLKGHGGAYDTYEMEMRIDRIIEKLDIIISNLEGIKSNQYLLYEKIKESNNNITMIGNQIDKQIKSSMSKIDDNISVNNYYSKISAENTKVLTWMKDLYKKYDYTIF